MGAPVGVDTLGRLCLIGDTPDFGGLKNAASFLAVCRSLFPAWQQEEAARLVPLFDLPPEEAAQGIQPRMQTALLLCAGPGLRRRADGV